MEAIQIKGSGRKRYGFSTYLDGNILYFIGGI